MSASLKHNFLHSNRMIQENIKNRFVRIIRKNRLKTTIPPRIGHRSSAFRKWSLRDRSVYTQTHWKVRFIRTAELKLCQYHLLSSMKREVAWLLMTFGGKSLRIEHTVDFHVFHGWFWDWSLAHFTSSKEPQIGACYGYVTDKRSCISMRYGQSEERSTFSSLNLCENLNLHVLW